MAFFFFSPLIKKRYSALLISLIMPALAHRLLHPTTQEIHHAPCCSTPRLPGTTGKSPSAAYLWAGALPSFDNYSPLIEALKQLQSFDAFPQYLPPFPLKTRPKDRQVSTVLWYIKSRSVNCRRKSYQNKTLAVLATGICE